jgi:hypothetical protein
MATNVTTNGNRVTITTTEGDALRQTQQAAVSNPIDSLTLADALAWIDANVVDLPSARAALKQLAKTMFVLRAQVQRDRLRQ